MAIHQRDALDMRNGTRLAQGGFHPYTDADTHLFGAAYAFPPLPLFQT